MQNARTMRALLIVAVTLTSSVASAQTTTTCTGPFTATTGLSTPTQSVAPTSIMYVFDKAECDCNTNDITMQIHLTAGIPATMSSGQVQAWVGTSCDMTTMRIANSTFCEDITALVNPSYASFVTGQPSFMTDISIPIPSAPLFTPTMPNARSCAPRLQLNSFYLLFAPTDDFSTATSCSLTLGESTEGPLTAVGATVSSGESAVSINWSAPFGTINQIPVSYQILCADNNGVAVPGKVNGTRAYSICLPGGDLRRRTNLASSGATTTDLDAGTTTILDAGSEPLSEPLGTDSVDGGLDDGGADGGAFTTIGNSDFAKSMNPDFTCTGEIKPGAGTLSARIDGLTDGHTYQFVILAIDAYGNPTASDVILGTPQPTEDLYKRYRDEGGGATGFCFIATAAYGSYENRYVKVLRDFRDEVLLPTDGGRAFVDWYYAHSPAAAQVIGEHRALRILTQMVLWPIIAIAAMIVYLTAWQKALLLTLILAWCFRRRFAARVRA